jgi:hypothetical protein
MITHPEILRERAKRNRCIVELAKADPNLRMSDIAEMTDCSWGTVAIIFRRNGISRKEGRRPKAVSRG